MKVLLVEDDKTLGETLLEVLQKEGYATTWKRNLQTAREACRDHFDLILLDLSLPDGLSFDLAREIGSATPFIFMTAHSDSENRLKGFELGAHEFIPKPFHLKELLLRIKHVQENHIQGTLQKRVLKNGRTIDLARMKILDVNGQSLNVTPRDFQVLRVILDGAPRVVSRDEILEKVLGDEEYPTARTVDNSVLRLRQCLGNDSWIKSVRGIGYQWQEE